MAVVIVTPNDRRGLLGVHSSTKVIIDWNGHLAYEWAMANMDTIADVLIEVAKLNPALLRQIAQDTH